MRAPRPFFVSLLAFILLLPLLALSGFGLAAPGSRLPASAAASVLGSRPAQDEADGASRLLYSVAPDAPDAALQEIIDSHVKDLPGDWSVVVKKLDTGQYAAYRGDEVTVSASLYKTFVLWELMRQVRAGMIALDDELTITAGAAAFDLSIGDLHFDIGSSQPISWLADRMIERSDNTAAITLATAVGVDNVNATMKTVGLTHSALNFSGGDNLTTANDITHLFEMVASGQAVSRPASAYMLDLYLAQQLNDLIPVGLPAGTPYAHKTGTLEMLMHDAGIVYGPSGPYVITVFSSNLDDYPTAYHNMPILSQAIYEYFNGRSFQPARYFPQTQQVVGPAFLLYYNTHGGLDNFGLPIAAEREESGIVYQYFERGRLERPSGASGPISLGRVGAELLKLYNRQFEPGAEPDPSDTTTQWFAETQQQVGPPFLDYWTNHGGREIFGLPLSPVLSETVNDTLLQVQYFERARLELHGDQIELGAIGAELQNGLSSASR